MNELLARSWWMLAVLGVIAMLFAVLALMWPGLTLLSLVVLFAAYALSGGIMWIMGAIRHRESSEDWWLVLLLGLVSIGAGLIAVFHPELTALVLVLVMGANALITGVLEIIAAIRLRKEIQSEWLMILTGIIAIAFGVFVFLFQSTITFPHNLSRPRHQHRHRQHLHHQIRRSQNLCHQRQCHQSR